MNNTRYIELLSPAQNLEYGIAAINYGADAVYIGANKFGARASVGNSIQDIEKLCKYAHLYNAKVCNA
jgi:putative protease